METPGSRSPPCSTGCARRLEHDRTQAAALDQHLDHRRVLPRRRPGRAAAGPDRGRDPRCRDRRAIDPRRRGDPGGVRPAARIADVGIGRTRQHGGGLQGLSPGLSERALRHHGQCPPRPLSGKPSGVVRTSATPISPRRSAPRRPRRHRLVARREREAQLRLKAIGFDPGKIQASFQPGARKAVADWQRSRSIAETGYLTPVMRTALWEQSEPDYRKMLEKAPVETLGPPRAPSPPRRRRPGGTPAAPATPSGSRRPSSRPPIPAPTRPEPRPSEGSWAASSAEP